MNEIMCPYYLLERSRDRDKKGRKTITESTRGNLLVRRHDNHPSLTAGPNQKQQPDRQTDRQDGQASMLMHYNMTKATTTTTTDRDKQLDRQEGIDR